MQLVVNFTSAHLLLMLIQVSALILKIPANWPSAFSGIATAIGAVNVDTNAIGIYCAFRLSFDQLLTVLLFIPFGLIAVIVCLCLGRVVWEYNSSKSAWTFEGVKTRMLNISINAILALGGLVHIPLSEQFTSVFECVTDGG